MRRRIRRLVPVVLLSLALAPAAGAWTWPVQGPVLESFSFDRAHPYAAGQHRGIAIGAEPGTPVVAPAGGAVSFAGTVPASGKTVTIETPGGLSVTLTHLGSIAVTRDATIEEGAVVGTVGPSGTTELTVPYVHLGIRESGNEQGYLDPLSFLPVASSPVAPPPRPAAAPAPPAVTAPTETNPAVTNPAAPAPLASPASAPSPQPLPVQTAPVQTAPAQTAPAQTAPAVTASPEPAVSAPPAAGVPVSAGPAAPPTPGTPGTRAAEPLVVARPSGLDVRRTVHAVPAAPKGRSGPSRLVGVASPGPSAPHLRGATSARRAAASVPAGGSSESAAGAAAPRRAPYGPRASGVVDAGPRSGRLAALAALGITAAVAVAWFLSRVAAASGLAAARATAVRMIRGPRPTVEGAPAVVLAEEDPRRARLAVRERPAPHRARRRLRGAGRRLRALSPLEGRRRPDGQRDGRARDAGDGVRGPKWGVAA